MLAVKSTVKCAVFEYGEKVSKEFQLERNEGLQVCRE